MEQKFATSDQKDPSIRRFRRVATGHNAQGYSVVLSDSQPPHGPPFMGIAGFSVTDLWKSDSIPVDNSAATDANPCAGSIEIAPPVDGVVFRMTQFPPESTWRSLNDEAAADDGSPSASTPVRHPHMHQTRTLDLALIVEGEIWAVMEDGETRLRAGDVLIQRGTQHAWANRSDAPCVIAFTMIDARPLEP